MGIAELGTSPSCLVLDARKAFLYSANETDRVGDDKHGTVSAWKIDPASGMLTLLNSVTSGELGQPMSVCIRMANSCWSPTTLVAPSRCIQFSRMASLAKQSTSRPTKGASAPTKATHAPVGSFAFSGHDRTHAHMIETDLSGKWVIHCDLGKTESTSGASMRPQGN